MHLCARSEAEEVDALAHAVNADLRRPSGGTIGHHLAHAVVHDIGVFGIAAFDIQGVVDGVRVDADFAHVLSDVSEVGDDAFRSRNASRILGNDTIGVINGQGRLVGEDGVGGLTDFNGVAEPQISVVEQTMREFSIAVPRCPFVQANS